MIEPPRLLDDPALDAIDRSALRSAVGDVPSERARNAARLALGIGAGALTIGAGTTSAAAGTAASVGASAGGAAGKTAGWLLAVKLASSALLITVAGTAGYVGLQSKLADRATRSSAPSAPQVRATRATPAPSTHAVATDSPSSVPTAITPDLLPDSPPIPRAAPQPARPLAKAQSSPTPEPPAAADPTPPAPYVSTLAAETARIDRARAELAHGDASGALATLRLYNAEHPNGTLHREALLLTADAQLASGRLAEARRTAHAYVRTYPSAVPARIQELVDRSPGE